MHLERDPFRLCRGLGGFGGIIPTALETAFAFGRLEETGAALQDSEKARDGALRQFSQCAFHFGDRPLMGIEVRGVGRQIRTVQVLLARIYATRAFVSLEIVEHDDVAFLQVGRRWCSSQASNVSAFVAIPPTLDIPADYDILVWGKGDLRKSDSAVFCDGRPLHPHVRR